LSFNLARALRRIKPQRAANALQRRPTAQLPLVQAPPSAGPELLLDTCVYLDVLQGRTPPSVDDLISARIVNHSTVCLAELTHVFGRLDPAHPGTKGVLSEIRQTIEDMRAHRLTSPSATALGEAGMLTGLAERLRGARGADPEEHPIVLNDAVIYLHALERGWIVLTRNLRDFDYFDQLLPVGRVLFYQQA
jgi:predicted nucleic acid-binding protein